MCVAYSPSAQKGVSYGVALLPFCVLGERAGRFLFPSYAHVCVIFAWNSAGRVNLKMIPTHWTRVICNANSIFGSFCVAEQIMAPLCSSAEIKVIRAADGNLEIWCNYKESAQIAS
jgi:hypothetical protein